MQLTASINILEVVWVVLALMGGLIRLEGLKDFYLDRMALNIASRSTTNAVTKAAWIIVNGSIRHTWSHLFIKTVLATSGFVQMVILDDVTEPIYAPRQIVRVLLVLALAFMVWDAWRDRVDRRAILAEEILRETNAA